MGLSLYPDICYQGYVPHDANDNETDLKCKAIYDACKGFGTDETTLINVLGALTAEQRCKIFPRFTQMFKKNLVHLMREECGNRPFGEALQILGQDPLSADCHLLAQACKEKNKFLIISIICGRTNDEIELLRKKWFDWKSEDIGPVLQRELRGGLEHIVLAVLGHREGSGYFTEEDKERGCQLMRDALGARGAAPNEKSLFYLLRYCPPAVLEDIDGMYAGKYGCSLAEEIKEKLSGDVRDAALYQLGFKLDTYGEVAKLIDRACKGRGADELLLSATLIRYQAMLKHVDAAHVELYQQRIRDRVIDETKRDHERLLLAVLSTAGI